MKRSLYIIGGITLAISMPSHLLAQTTQPKDTTMNRTVVVEQEYNPDIMDASKVNVLPKVEEPTVSKKEVEYATTFFPATSVPAGLMNPYTGKEIQPGSAPGYVRAGYGNLGNLDILANYLFRLSKKDKLNVRFQMDGMDGKLTLPYTDGEKWNAFYYRTRANVDYTHQFNKLDLNIAGNFGLSNFNFMPGSTNNKQKFLSGDVHFGIKSTSEELPLQFHAETNLMFYERQHDIQYQDAQEVMVRTKAGAMGTISEEQFVGVDLSMDNTFYKNNLFEDYTSVELNPYYLYQSEDWKIRLGAHVDFAFGFGKKFRVAPDVTAQYIFSDSYILYAQATGGRQANDFRRLEMVSPYGQSSTQLDATYEQLNAALGFKTSPVTGLWFNIYGGYQDLKNNLASAAIANYSGSYLQLLQGNMHNIYAGAEASYSYKDIISFTASGVYRDWKTAKTENNSGDQLLYYMPSFEANFKVDIRPISSVLINLGYQHITREKIGNERVDPVGNLYLGGSYEVFEGISIYVRANNLLNKDYQYYWGYPTEGINFMGGVSFRF